ncbi:MAG: WD40 repeat domain-containing protein [Leptothrix sp. (in: b-proteobacteria)]
MARNLLKLSLVVILCALPKAILAAVVCPPMPTAVTNVNKDVKSDISATVGSLGKLKAGEVAIKTEIFSKNLFDKYPNVDKLLTLQTMAATYCQMLNQSSIGDSEKLDRWEKFQEKVLDLQSRAKPTNGGKTKASNPISRLPTDKSVLTLPSEDCIGSRSCPHIFSIAFSPDSSLLAYANRSGDVRIWSLNSNREINRLIGLTSSVSGINFDSKGEALLSQSSEGITYIWDIQTGKPLSVLGDSDHRYSEAVWSRSGDKIILAPLMGTMNLWTRETQTITDFGTVDRSLAISPDGTLVAASQFSRSILLKSTITNEEVLLSPRPNTATEKLIFSDAGDKLLTDDQSGVLRTWNTKTKELLFQTTSPGGSIKDLLFSPDASLIAAISLNGGIWLFDSNGKRLRELTFKYRDGKSSWAKHQGNAWSMSFSPDGKLIAAGSVNGEVVVFDVTTGDIKNYFVGHLEEQIIMVRFSPDGKLVASACFDGTVKVWRIDHGVVGTHVG